MAKRNIYNKRPENHEEVSKLFGKGIENRSELTLSGVINKDKYISSKNARVSSRTNFSSLERINGEIKINSSSNEEKDDYVCIGSEVILGNIISFWASEKWKDQDRTSGIIVINGDVVSESVNFPIRHCYRLDIAKNENCLGGEVYISDNNLPPMYFNIKDLMQSYASNSLKYFDDFDYRDYIINTNIPTNSLVFDNIRDVGENNGLPVGQYSYSYRAVSENGDKTNWSVATPMIIIPKYQVKTEPIEQTSKYTGTKGGVSNVDFNTNYAPVLRLRVDNKQGYNYIELKRTEYNNGQGIGYLPQAYIVQRIQIFDNQFSVLEIVDSSYNETDRIAVSADDETNAISVIKRAEAIRYFNNRIILGNIEYEDRDVDSVELTLTQKNLKGYTPMMHYIGEDGFKDSRNAVYHKSYLNGERYGFAVLLWDSSFQRILVKQIDELKDVYFPEKRKNISNYPDAENASRYYNRIESDYAFEVGNVILPTNMFVMADQDINNSAAPSATFEVVMHSEFTEHHKEVSGGDKKLIVNNTHKIEKGSGRLIANITQEDYYTPTFNTVSASGYGSEVRNPTSDNDNSYESRYDRNYASATEVFTGSTWNNYTPSGFSPHYNSLGLCIYGISGFPDWVEGFSIVRTKPAKRVICQGLGVHPLEEMGVAKVFADLGYDKNGTTVAGSNLIIDMFPGVNNPNNPKTLDGDLPVLDSKFFSLRQAKKKAKNVIHCSFPDIDSALISQSELNKITTNPSSYKLQFVEPLQYFSEAYNGAPTYSTAEGANEDMTFAGTQMTGHSIDMVTYARVQVPARMTSTNISSEPYITFGRSRGTNPIVSGFIGDPNGFIFGIESIDIITEGDRGSTYLEITLDTDIWEKESFIGNGTDSDGLNARHYEDAEVKNFHEPFYIVNIINDTAEIKDTSTKEYLMPLNYIKINSKIGICNNLDTQVFDIVDERPEDFYTHPKSGEVGNKNKFIYVRKVGEKNYLPFINITNLTPIEIAQIDLDIDDETTLYCGKEIKGKYKATKSQVTISDTFSYTALTISDIKIKEGDEVYVKYDNTQQISLFGGEIMHNDSVFTYKDRKSIIENVGVTEAYPHHNAVVFPLSVDKSYFGTQFALGFGYPHSAYRMSKQVYKHHYYGGHGRVQEEREFSVGFLRQWLFIYTCQARTNLSYMYGDYFPNVNYVERPNIWNKDKTITENKVYEEYERKYPNENNIWQYGGFRIRFLKKEELFNFDFSKEPVHDKTYARKTFLSENNQRYCTRLAWSQPKPINTSNSQVPSLRTFRPFNYYDLPDKNGDIRKIHIARDKNGDNIYVFCENEISLVLTQKQTLSTASGQVLATTGTNSASFISQDIPLNIGLVKGLQKKHKWSFSERGSKAYYANENGVFEFSESGVSSISDGNYDRILSLLQDNFGILRIVGESNSLNLECMGYSYYDDEFEEYAYYIKNPIVVYNDFCERNLFPSDKRKTADITDANNFIFEVNDISESMGALTPADTLKTYIVDSSLDSKVFYISNLLGNDIDVVIRDKDNNVISSFTVNSNEIRRITKSVINGVIQSVENTVITKDLLDNNTNLFVYCDNERVKSWTSEYDYKFDSILYYNGKKYGFRNLEVYELDDGNTINNQNINFEVVDVINNKDGFDFEKEHISIQVNTNNIDKNNLSVQVFKESLDSLHSVILGSSMKKYAGFWSYINRDSSGKRHQGNFFLYKVLYNGVNNINLKSVNLEYKHLK